MFCWKRYDLLSSQSHTTMCIFSHQLRTSRNKWCKILEQLSYGIKTHSSRGNAFCRHCCCCCCCCRCCCCCCCCFSSQPPKKTRCEWPPKSPRWSASSPVVFFHLNSVMFDEQILESQHGLKESTESTGAWTCFGNSWSFLPKIVEYIYMYIYIHIYTPIAQNKSWNTPTKKHIGR